MPTIKEIRRRNLALLEREAGSWAALARAAGTSASYLSQICTERKTQKGTIRAVGDELAKKLERGMGKPRGWMDTNHVMEDRSDYQANVSAKNLPAHSVPLRSWEDLWHPPTDQKDGEFVMTTKTVGPRAIALRVHGDSMVGGSGERIGFPEGAFIIVDPDITPASGSFVVARAKHGQRATFKQLVEDGGTMYLKPLNPRYPLLELTDTGEILGVVVSMTMDIPLS